MRKLHYWGVVILISLIAQLFTPFVYAVNIENKTVNEVTENRQTENLTSEITNTTKEENLITKSTETQKVETEENTTEVQKQNKTKTQEENNKEINLMSSKAQTIAKPTKTIGNGTYKIKANIGSNMYLDVSGGSKSDGANVQIWKGDNVDQQKFKVEYQNNGYYKITAVHSKKVLDVEGAGKSNGTNVDQYTSNGTDAQLWKLEDTGNGNYNIISKCNGLYLDINGAKAESGTNVQVYKSNGSNAQKFKIDKPSNSSQTKPAKTISDGVYRIESKLNNKMVVDISEESKANEANVQIWENYNKKNQMFHVKNLGNGYYSIRAVHSKKSLDVVGAGTSVGTNVNQYDYNGSDAQQWIIRDTGDNEYFYIISKCNLLYLDIAGGIAQSGTNVQMYKPNGSNAQMFKFEKAEYQEIDDGIYEIEMAKDSNKVIDVSGGSIENNAKVQIWDKSPVNQQRFRFQYDKGSKTYTIEAVHSGKVLDVAGGTAKNSTKVQQYEKNNSTAQKWKIKDNGDGTYNIISQCGGLYLDVASGLTNNGQQVQIYEANGSQAQLFRIVESSEVINGSANYNTLNDAKYPGFKSVLQNVQKAHPNWNIQVYYTGLDWNAVIDGEYQMVAGSPRSLTQETNEWRVDNTKYDVSKSWYRATKKAIAYMMDPRNSLEDKWIFQFQDLSSSSGTTEDIKKMVAGTFIDNTSCINAILEAARTQGISPFHIASRIIQESGKSGGAMNGYEYNGRKVYNLYNINVSGNDGSGLQRGAKYAYDRGWFTQEASIKGGAEFLKTNYIGRGQSTLYYQKFNVVEKNNLYNHQYMQNIHAANNEGNTMYNDYKASGLLESHFTFSIPVYENMPSSACPRPNS